MDKQYKLFDSTFLMPIFFVSTLILGNSAQALNLLPELADMEVDSGSCLECSFPQPDRGLASIGENFGEFGRIIPANVFSEDGTDPREVQDRTGDGTAFSPIGAIIPDKEIVSTNAGDGSQEGRPRSTAFLVSPCHILTNYHAVFGASKTPKKGDFSATFHVGAGSDGTGFLGFVTAKPVFRKGVLVGGNPGKPKEQQPAGEDWVLMELKSCVGAKIGWMELSTSNDLENECSSFGMAGYPGDLEPGTPDSLVESVNLRADKQCFSVQQYRPGVGVGHSCASRQGSSGSPIYCSAPGEQPTVVALHSRSVTKIKPVLKFKDFNAETENRGPAISDILPMIQDIINTSKEQFGNNNPAAIKPGGSSILKSSVIRKRIKTPIVQDI